MAEPAWKPWHEVVKLREDERCALVASLLASNPKILEKISNYGAARGDAPQEELKL